MSDSHQLLNQGGPVFVGAGPSSRPRDLSASNLRNMMGGLSAGSSNSSNLASCGEVQHVCYLSEHIGSLYLNDSYSDITLKVEDTLFQAHRVILAARSEYFRALLYGGMRESSECEIELKDTNVGAFKVLLRYIYTGKISLTNLKEDLILEILGLAHIYGFNELEDSISEYLKAVLNPRNLCTVFGASHLFSLNSLTHFCLDFADKHATEILSSDGFLGLSASAVDQLLSRDSFCAPEVDIFRSVREWVRNNPDTDPELVVGQIRDDTQMASDIETSSIRVFVEKGVPEVNVSTPSQGAQVIEGELKQALLNGDTQNYDMERGFTRHPIETGNEGIVIQLGTQCILNHIRLLLWDRDQRSYSYYVEVSMDRKDWVRVVDHSQYLCRAWQKIYFSPKVVRYIRVYGTHNTVNRVFHLVALEACYTLHPFNIDEDFGLLAPKENMATIESTASVIEGVSRSRNALLNGDTEHYDWDSGYTCHQLGSGAIVIQLPHPYVVDSMRLLLWDCDDRTYSYYIEVSADQQNWKVVADRTKEACKSWQLLRFDKQPVTFVRIVGTHNSANEVFHCVHFECPAQGVQPLERSAHSSSSSVSRNVPGRSSSRNSVAQGLAPPAQNIPQSSSSGAVLSLHTSGSAASFDMGLDENNGS